MLVLEMHKLVRNKKVRSELFRVDTEEQAKHIWKRLPANAQRTVRKYNDIGSRAARVKFLEGEDGSQLLAYVNSFHEETSHNAKRVSSEIKAIKSTKANNRATHLTRDLESKSEPMSVEEARERDAYQKAVVADRQRAAREAEQRAAREAEQRAAQEAQRQRAADQKKKDDEDRKKKDAGDDDDDGAGGWMPAADVLKKAGETAGGLGGGAAAAKGTEAVIKRGVRKTKMKWDRDSINNIYDEDGNLVGTTGGRPVADRADSVDWDYQEDDVPDLEFPGDTIEMEPLDVFPTNRVLGAGGDPTRTERIQQGSGPRNANDRSSGSRYQPPEDVPYEPIPDMPAGEATGNPYSGENAAAKFLRSKGIRPVRGGSRNRPWKGGKGARQRRNLFRDKPNKTYQQGGEVEPDVDVPVVQPAEPPMRPVYPDGGGEVWGVNDGAIEGGLGPEFKNSGGDRLFNKIKGEGAGAGAADAADVAEGIMPEVEAVVGNAAWPAGYAAEMGIVEGLTTVGKIAGGIAVPLLAEGAEQLGEWGTTKIHEQLNPDEDMIIDVTKAGNIGKEVGTIAGAAIGLTEAAGAFAAGTLACAAAGPFAPICGAVLAGLTVAGNAGMGHAFGGLLAETTADAVDIIHDGIAAANRTVPATPGTPVAPPVAPVIPPKKPSNENGFAPERGLPDSRVLDVDEDVLHEDPDGKKHTTDSLRQTFEQATPEQVIAVSKQQLRSDIEFDMFSYVKPGFGNGPTNKLFNLQNARDAIVINDRSDMTPGQYLGPTDNIEPGPWQFQRVIPEKLWMGALGLKNNRLKLARSAADAYKDIGTSNLLGDDYGFGSKLSAKGLPRRGGCVLEPVIRNDMHWTNTSTPTGYELNRKRPRLGTDAQRYPEHLDSYTYAMGGPTTKRRRALGIVLS